MEVEFWHEKWQKNEIGFHENKPNPILVKNIEALNLDKGSRIFLPLCGKTLDITWLLSKNYKIVGSELSQLAVDQLFTSLEIAPTITRQKNCYHYSSKDIDIYVGDIFELRSEQIGKVDAVYDRAALVALPEEMRNDYTKHLRLITGTAKQLLVTFEYDQSIMSGPPFSITGEEVNRHYEQFYQLKVLESKLVEGGLKGMCEACEHCWLLSDKNEKK